MSYPLPPTYEESIQPAYNPSYTNPNYHQPIYSVNNQAPFQPLLHHHTDVGPFDNVAYASAPVYTTIASGPVPTTTIVIRLGPHPAKLQCPYCREDIVTKTTSQNGLLTWILFAALALFGCWCCCCLPFCARSCRDVIHNCPNCRCYIGTHRRI